MSINREKIVAEVVTAVTSGYDKLQGELATKSLTRHTEGETRRDAGNLIEAVLQTVFDTINKNLPKDEQIVSVVGKSDTLSKTLTYKGQIIVFSSIQVGLFVPYLLLGVSQQQTCKKSPAHY